jgi:hypothetical protein
MGGLLGLGALAVALAVALVVGLVLRRRTALPADANVPPEVVQTATAWRWAGVVAGIVVSSALLVSELWSGRGVMLAAPAFGLCVVAGVIVGEARARPAMGTTRAAALEVRSVRDYLPRDLTRLVTAATVVLLAVLVATTATGSADEFGRAGRMLQARCESPDMPGVMGTEARGPWPGSFYSGPLALTVLVGLTTAGAALRQIVRRARTGEDPTAVAADDALRRRAAHGVTAACGILVTVPLVGVSLFTAPPLLGITCLPTWAMVAGVGLLALVPAVLVLTTWCLAAILAATPRATRTPAPS